MPLPSFDELIAHSETDWPLVYSDAHPDHKGLRFKSHPLPVSINEQEYRYLYDFIVAHKLRHGLDIATGVGISALAMGFAFRETGGSCLSVDTYAEQETQQSKQDLIISRTFDWMPSCIFSRQLGLKIDYHKGHFPIEFNFAMYPPFDMVMLDCPKCDADLEMDLKALLPCLAKQFAIFIHDTHMMPRAAELVRSILNVPLMNVMPIQKFPFMLATNIPKGW